MDQLSIKCTKKIRNWYYYRNKKTKKLIQKQIKIKEEEISVQNNKKNNRSIINKESNSPRETTSDTIKIYNHGSEVTRNDLIQNFHIKQFNYFGLIPIPIVIPQFIIY